MELLFADSQNAHAGVTAQNLPETHATNVQTIMQTTRAIVRYANKIGLQVRRTNVRAAHPDLISDHNAQRAYPD